MGIIKKCFYCGEEIRNGEGRIVPLDKPYVNLWGHRGICSNAMDEEYLKNNVDRIYNYIEEVQGQKIKKK